MVSWERGQDCDTAGMSTSWTVVEPTPEAWQAIPLRASAALQGGVAWLVVTVAAVASFVVDLLVPTERVGGDGAPGVTALLAALMPAVLVGFVFMGWCLLRHAVVAAPVVSVLAALASIELPEPLALVWWIAAGLTAGWALLQAAASWRQLLAVRAVERDHRTEQQVDLDLEVVKALRRLVLTSVLWALGLSLAAAAAATVWWLLWGSGHWPEVAQDDDSPLFAAVLVFTLAILGVSQWIRVAWILISRLLIPPRVWMVPAGGGPVEFYLWQTTTGIVDHATAARTPGCICEEDEEDWVGDLGIMASAYCPAHGIDRVNGLSPDEFSALAEEPWLWDAYSQEPVLPSSRSLGRPLVRFSGHAFTGLFARIEGRDCLRWGDLDAARESDSGSGPRESAEIGESATWPSSSGVLDVIHLQTPRIQGFAVRYRHDRAQFVPERGGSGAEIPPAFLAHLS